MDTQYYMIGTDGYPIISAVSLDGFTEYVVGQEPTDLANALPKIQEELATLADKDLWDELDRQRSSLTVTTNVSVGGNTFAANKSAIENIRLKSKMPVDRIIPWKEAWGTFNTNAIELQEALILIAIADQVLFDSIFGV